jgi:hypothetical protein
MAGKKYFLKKRQAARRTGQESIAGSGNRIVYETSY